METQHFRVEKECELLVWPEAFVAEFINATKSNKVLTTPMLLGIRPRIGHEIIVEYGKRNVIVPARTSEFQPVSSIDVTVSIGQKKYSGCVLAYSSSTPSLTSDPHALRVIKKRKQNTSSSDTSINS